MAERKMLSKHVTTVLGERKELTAKDIFDAAKKGDFVAEELVEEFGDVLGATLATVACVINPQVFIIGGGVSKAGNILLNAIKQSFERKAFHMCRDTKFVLAELGNDAGIYGGMRLVMEEG